MCSFISIPVSALFAGRDQDGWPGEFASWKSVISEHDKMMESWKKTWVSNTGHFCLVSERNPGSLSCLGYWQDVKKVGEVLFRTGPWHFSIIAQIYYNGTCHYDSQWIQLLVYLLMSSQTAPDVLASCLAAVMK
uniref:Uncharacterized protein n=1 Tax=Sphaerodactylus townsendi TaxID=933632 RepID=A0ACB8ER15_9SAUR